MKKQLSFIMAVIISITSVMLAFLCIFQPKVKTNALDEDSLVGKVDIVDPNNMGASFVSDMVLNQNPFDISTKEMMTGYSVVPKTINSLKDINSTYVVDKFSVVSGESIYMWIFIPNDYIFDLKISFEDNSSNTMSWSFSKSELIEISTNSSIDGYSYGWRLFEFCIDDAEMTDFVRNNIATFDFESFNISYTNSYGTYIEKNKNHFSFYHIYLAKSSSYESTIVDSQCYVQYVINPNFTKDRSYFVDDEILFDNVKSIFDVLIIGQINLRDYSNSNYSFDISVQAPDGDVKNKYFGEKFIFDDVGYYRVSCTIKEFRSDKSEVVLYEQMDFYVDYFVMGAFTNVNYKFEKGEKTAIAFKFSKSFLSSEDIVVEVSDKTIAEVTHYVKNSVCYIQVNALKEGEFNLIVKAKGERVGTNDTKEYSVLTSAKVIDSDKKTASEVFLLVILAVYGGGFVIFVVISFVKARQISVK